MAISSSSPSVAQPSTPPSPKPVLIIGSGLAGLALAQGLLKAQLLFEIYERDASASARAQGYRVRINPDGKKALETLLSAELCGEFERSCASNDRLGMAGVDARTGQWMRYGPKPGAPPTPAPAPAPVHSAGAGAKKGKGGSGPAPLGESLPADRRVLRRILLSNLSPYLTYSKSFVSYTLTTDGVIANFADGTTSAEGSFLVGVDGRGSRVARQYLGREAAPVDTLTRLIYGKTPLTPELDARLPPYVKEGMALVSDPVEEGSRTFFTECMRFDRTRSASESDAGMDIKDKDSEQEHGLRDYVYWVMLGSHSALGVRDDETLLSSRGKAAANSLAQQDERETAVMKLTTASPFGFPTWSPSGRVTLMGDAIHAMPPAGGQGANTALKDAATLCAALVGRRNELERQGGWSTDTIGKYEDEMRGHAEVVVKESYQVAVRVFGVLESDQGRSR